MEEKARKFAVWNSANYFTRDALYSLLSIMIIFGAMFMYGKLPHSALPMTFAGVYILWMLSLRFWAKNEFRMRYLISAEATLFMSVFCLIMACVSSIDKTGSFAGSIMLIAGRCLEEILCVALTVSFVGWSCYDRRKKVLLVALNVAAAAGIIVLLAFAIYDDVVHPEKEMGMVTPLCAVLSYICVVDGFVFVKYFYCEIYGITEDDSGDSGADKLFEGKLSKSTVGELILAVIFAGFLIFARFRMS